MDGGHLLEASQLVAFWYQLRNGSLVQRARDQEHDVVDHVAVRDEVEEGGQGARGLVPHVLEFCHQFLPEAVIDLAHLQRTRNAGQKVAIIGALQMQLQICNQKNYLPT